MLYTNFESEYALRRALPYLKRINKNHILVVVFFEDTEIAKVQNRKIESLKDVYFKTFAQKFNIDKAQISLELRKNGIQSILTKPEELTVNTINKYLELKSRGTI